MAQMYSGKTGENIRGREFLRRYYEADTVKYDNPAVKLAKTILPETVVNRRSGKRLRKLAEAASDLKKEGSAGDEILNDDIFVEDSEAFITTEKRKLSKRTKVSLFLLLVLIPATIALGVYLFRGTTYAPQNILQEIFGSRVYYFISLVIMVYALVPFFMVFEGRKPQAREMIVLASMAALACAGRAAFFMLPSFKPIVAIVIISGIAFGGEAGFLVGAVTMLVSNFLFGQGPWTPWQMFAMGFIGFLTGVLHQKGFLPARRLTL